MKTIKGIGASPGCIHGVAIILNEDNKYDEKINICSNSIIVVHSSSPQWIIELFSAGGIICEVGGRMSHLAIICRELNKPCVTNVENACKLLQDGNNVMIDGSTGEIVVYG